MRSGRRLGAASGDPFDSLIRRRRKLRARRAYSRYVELRRDLHQRCENEGALMQAGMRHAQPRFVDARIAIEQEVEIQRARRVREAALAAMAGFDRLELTQ